MFREVCTPTAFSSHPRPILIKLSSAWDRKLVLLCKSTLRNFRIKQLFLREDVSPDHQLRKGKPNAPTNIPPHGELPAGSVAGISPSGGDASTAEVQTHSSLGSVPHSSSFLSPKECEASSLGTCPTPDHAESQHPSLSSSSSSSTLVQGSLDDRHDSS